jgi:hypothetical protein
VRLLDKARGLEDSRTPDGDSVLGGSTAKDGGFMMVLPVAVVVRGGVVGLCAGERLASSEEESSPRLLR